MGNENTLAGFPVKFITMVLLFLIAVTSDG